MPEFFDDKASVPEVRKYKIRILGVNGSLTQQLGQGVTASRSGEGAYDLTWSKNPGTFVGWSYGFGAATPANLAGYTAVRDTYNSTTWTLPFVVYSDTPAAADLIADEYIDITVEFAATSEIA